MAKISVLTKDFDDSLLNRTDPIVYLPKVAAPFTTVVKRALMTDLANDLLPRFGVDRVMTQAIQEVQGESGPNGERVFKPINDQHDAVRLSSGSSEWLQSIDSNGQHPFINVSGTIEISFYGTGLNLITGYYTGSLSFDIRATIDGGSEGANFMPASTTSGILGGRNYNSNQIINVASNLSLGLHTIKLRIVSLSTTFILFGYEVLNTNSTLQLLPGRSYLGGKRLYKAAASTDAYNSNFESGTLGTKGGHVVVYQKSDGTVAKAVQPTNASQANLTSADHTNESVIRTINYREFGSGRSDDFSSASGTVAPRAFTLDDGTTTLVHNNAAGSLINGVDVLQLPGNTNFLTLTFVGTGLDIIETDSAAGGSDSYTVSIDGATGLAMATAGLTTVRVVKICSGLPYGTHTVKVTRVTAATFALCVKEFIIYGPSKPSLPSGAIELGDYYLMADFVATTFGVDVVPSGVLRKFTIREWVYVGTGFTVTTLQPISNPGGWAVRSSTIGETYSYTFFGTGFDLTGHGSIGTASGTISIDGSLYTGAASVTNTATWTPGTSTFTLTSASCAGRVRVTGLSLGLHKVTLTVATAESLNIPNIDIITPVHSPKNNQPGDLQNTLPLGSCAIGDSRKFSSTSVKTLANWAQAIGIASGPTTTSTSFVPVPDLSVTIKTSGNPVVLNYYVRLVADAAARNMQTAFYVDGVQVGSTKAIDTASANFDAFNTDNIIVALAAGTHKIDVYWLTTAGTATAKGISRNLTAREI